jgi:hypothetical protein
VKRPFKASKEIPELCHSVPLVMCMKTNCWFNQNRLLSHLRTSFCALAIAGASLTLPSAEAGRPEPASGEFFPCFNFAGPPRQVGENLIIRFNVTGTGTGTLTGSLDGTEMDVVHPDGSITLEGSLVFTGSIGARTGTLLFTYNGIGNINTGHENLRGVGRQGTGGLAGIYAQITLEGDLGAPSPGCAVSGAGTYTGQILFAP